MAKKTDKDIQTRKLKREVTFPLKGAELEGLGIILSNQIIAKVDLEHKFDAVKKDWKGQIERADLELMQTTKQIQDRTRTDIVMVEERKNFKKRIVEYIYESKVVETREMTEMDMQTELSVDSLKTEEHIPKDGDVADVIKLEKNKRTKKSSLDQPTV